MSVVLLDNGHVGKVVRYAYLDVSLSTWYDERPLPEWAWQFALLLDHAYLTDAQLRVAIGRPVKREQALWILNQVG